jgi:Fe/S biogenesis protein NfuA
VANSEDQATLADPVLRITDAARALVIEARSGETNAESLALFVEINGVSDGSFTYDMWFESPSDAGPKDVVQHHDDLSVVIGEQSIARLRGATLDEGASGLVILNPNSPPPAPGAVRPAPPSDLSSPVEQAVLAVLEAEINPQIASHGGRADLVAVDSGVAYLRLSGGCQGCGMAQVTLSQGISVAIREAVPEIVDIVDVTSHQDGTNPYFEAAKK